MEDLNLLITWAKNPKKYNKNTKACLEEFFVKTNIDKYDPNLYQKNILDYYEKEIYNSLYEKELKLQKISYNFDEAYFLYATEMLKEKKYKEAILYFEKALLWNPVNRNAIMLICKLHFSFKNFNIAYEYATKGLKIEFDKKNMAYYYSVLTVYYLKNKDYVKADECAINLYLLNNKDASTIKYLQNRKITEIMPIQEKNELIMDSLLNIIYNQNIIKAERARFVKILLSYEILPLFKYDKFYLVFESGVKNAEIKESIIVSGKYLICELNGKRYLDIKDKKGLFEKLVMAYFAKLNEFNLRLDQYQNEKEKYESEPICEEIKIKFNGKFYYIANTENKDISQLYLEMKENIIRLTSIMINNKETMDSILEVAHDKN